MFLFASFFFIILFVCGVTDCFQRLALKFNFLFDKQVCEIVIWILSLCGGARENQRLTGFV